MPIYTFSNLSREVRENFQGRTSNLIEERQILNRAVRRVILDIDLRSSKRSTQLSPSLFKRVYQYTAPVDLKGIGIIDIKQQVDRAREEDWTLTTPEEFDRQKRRFKNIMARHDADFNTWLLLSGIVNDTRQTIHNMDSITDNGTWTTDSDNTAANNLTRDASNFIQSAAALNFDVDTTGTVAEVVNSTMTALDLTDYEDGGAIFVWVYIPATTNIQDFVLHWGDDSDNHFLRTVTTTNEGLSFFVGWNLLRFDWDPSVTTDGTPTITSVNFIKLTLTLSAVLTNPDTDFRIDFIVARKGVIQDLIYYSRYLWQTAAGAYIENSTADGDLLNVETEEYDLIVEKANELVARALQDKDAKKDAQESYQEQRERYIQESPSERKELVTHYHEFASLRDIQSANLDT